MAEQHRAIMSRTQGAQQGENGNVDRNDLKEVSAIEQEIGDDMGAYLMVGPARSTLDGDFTADQLRRIADVMELMKASGVEDLMYNQDGSEKGDSE